MYTMCQPGSKYGGENLQNTVYTAYKMTGPRTAVQGRLARNGILGAATGVFSKRGYPATRVEDILAAAGIARRTFYKYFRSKDDVLAGIYELATDDLAARLRTAAAAPDDPIEAVRRVLDTYLDYHAADPRLVSALVQQALQPESPLHERRAWFRRQLVEVLDRAVHASTGTRHDPMLYAALLSGLEGASLDLLATNPTPDDVTRAKKVMRQLFDRALGLQPPGSVRQPR